MERKLTDEERLAMGLSIEPDVEPAGKFEWGWSKERIKEVIRERGFTVAGLERQAGIPKGSINQSLIARRPKTDKMLAGFFGVHESEIWPDRYFSNGVSIPTNCPITPERRAVAEADIAKRKHIKETIIHLGGRIEHIYRTKLPPGLEVSE